MQLPPVTLTELGFLFALGAIILLLTAELSSTYYGNTNLTINRRRLKNAAYGIGVIFLITVATRIVIIMAG
jgi:hypothetical protein